MKDSIPVRRWFWRKDRIESEFDKLRQEVVSLREQHDLLERALLFYSNEDNYPPYYAGPPSKVLPDKGLVARGVLERVWAMEAVATAFKEVAGMFA